ncbi:MAG TPA: XdhC/CoxI family protein [Conexibacter sp.]|nr:XdhC/CoxI family protein [Conexibacter sp.]
MKEPHADAGGRATASSDARPASLTESLLLERLRAGRRVVAAVLVDVEGSAPLPPGATMLIDEDGAIEGSITGGCVESAVVQEAQAILRDGKPPLLATYGISDELAGTVGLMCGGTVHVFVHEITPQAAAPLAAFLDAVRAERPAGLATLLDGERAGAKLALVDGEAIGALGAGALLDRNVAQDLQGMLDSGRSAVVRYALDGSRLGAEQRVHLHCHALPPSMVVFGAIDFSAALAPMARALGFRVTISDPRAAFARSPRFSRAAQVVVGWPEQTLDARALGPRDVVLVFSHDPKLDVPALTAALRTDAGYIGALGSRQTTADRNRRLREAGVTDAELARIFAPCGLDIGSATAEETAVAILAEIVAHRAGRGGRPLRETDDSIRPREAPQTGER